MKKSKAAFIKAISMEVTMLQFISKKIPGEYGLKNAERYEHLSDRNLIQKILNGNSYLFKLLVQRHNERLFRIQRSYISDEEAIKDTLQQTYMKAFENLDSWRGNAQFSTWITRIAINEALKYVKKQKRYSDLHDFNLTPDKDTQITAKTERTPEDYTIQQDLERLLEQAVDELSSTYRKVYIKREIEQMSTTRTAENLGISPGNVKVRLHRARKQLRQTLEQHVADPAIFY